MNDSIELAEEPRALNDKSGIFGEVVAELRGMWESFPGTTEHRPGAGARGLVGSDVRAGIGGDVGHGIDSRGGDGCDDAAHQESLPSLIRLGW